MNDKAVENVKIQSIEKSGYSHLKVRFNMTCMISVLQSGDPIYLSPIFSINYGEKLEWQIELVKCGPYAVEPVLILRPCNVSDLTIMVTYSVLNDFGNKVITLATQQHKSESVTYETKYDRSTNKYLSINSSELTSLPINLAWSKLVCDIELLIGRPISLIDLPMIKVPICDLNDNMGYLLESHKFSDFTINVDGQELPVHKNVLSVRSPVFEAMFELEMAEKHENRTNVTDIELDVFKEMLRFIYTDQAPNINKMAKKLLMAAEKYQLERLKLMCEELLCAQITSDNVVDMLKIADLHNANQLRIHALDFICLAPKHVIQTKDFKEMLKLHSGPIADILQAVIERIERIKYA